MVRDVVEGNVVGSAIGCLLDKEIIKDSHVMFMIWIIGS